VRQSMSSSSLRGQVQSGGWGSSLHSGIEFGRSRTGEGSSGGRKRGRAQRWSREVVSPPLQGQTRVKVRRRIKVEQTLQLRVNLGIGLYSQLYYR